MLGGEKVSEATLENVREMLKFSEKKKEEIKASVKYISNRI